MTWPSSWLICQIFPIFFDGYPRMTSTLPRGNCLHCCNINEEQDIKFFLYTKKNPSNPDQLYLNDDNRLEKSDFNIADPLVIYMHGFAESYELQSCQSIKNAFLSVGSYNVLIVDWSALATSPWYIDAVKNLRLTGRYIADFLLYLIKKGFPREHIHVIGFSLGAEVAGFIGEKMRDRGFKLPRITGLDPALPLLSSDWSPQKLSPTVAEFVDVIHTDGGIYGNPKPMGHADFYPNNGEGIQRGCFKQEFYSFHWMNIIFGCSHQRARQYFIETLAYPESFPSERCENCQNDVKAFMGMAADKRLRGKFYLNTRYEAPFGKNAP